MFKNFLYSLVVFTTLCNAVAFCATTTDSLNISAKILPEGNIIAAVSSSNPLEENWASITVQCEYIGSPSHDRTEETPKKMFWMAKATCTNATFKDNKSSYGWQEGSQEVSQEGLLQERASFTFALKSNTAAKYTISVEVSACFQNSDGTVGREGGNSNPIKTITITRDIWIVGIEKVRVKPKDASDDKYIDAPTEVVLLLGRAGCTFKAQRKPAEAPAWPGGKPVWTIGEQTFTGETLDRTAESSSSESLECECGNTKTLTVTNVNLELTSVDFKGENVQTIYDVGTESEWKKANVNGQGARNEPFCIVKDKSYEGNFVFSLSKSLTFETTISARCSLTGNDKEGNSGGTTYRTFTLKDQNQNISKEITISAENVVKKDTLKIVWSYEKQNSTNPEDRIEFGNTTHTRYVTWGKHKCKDIFGKDTYFTKNHIDYACKTANGAATLVEIGDKIGVDAVAKARFNIRNNHYYYPWSIIDFSVKSDCISLCRLMKSAIDLLGDDSAKIFFVYARHDSWVGLANIKDGAHETGAVCSNSNCEHKLFFWAGGPNSFEGCCRFENKWWMGGISEPNGDGSFKNHPLEVLRRVTAPNTSRSRHQYYECNKTIPVSYPASTDGKIPTSNVNVPYPNYDYIIENEDNEDNEDNEVPSITTINP
jgi:hypothetical protein